MPLNMKIAYVFAESMWSLTFSPPWLWGLLSPWHEVKVERGEGRRRVITKCISWEGSVIKILKKKISFWVGGVGWDGSASSVTLRSHKGCYRVGNSEALPARNTSSKLSRKMSSSSKSLV